MSLDADCLAKEVDTRLELSPYAASSVNLHLKDGTTFTIPSPLLRKCPKLPSPPPFSQTIRLEITRDIGHILVHYLFTDTYQCLRPKGSSPYGKLAAEFTTSVRVYALAREYALPSLEELAKREIERLGNGLRFPMVLDLVQSAYPDPSADDAWFSSYLKSGLKSLFQNPPELSDCGIPNAGRKTLSVSDLLFKNLVELVHDHAILPRDLDAAPQVEALEESAFVMPVPELGPPKEAALEPDDSDLSETCKPDLAAESEPDLPEICEPHLPAEAEPELYEPEPEPTSAPDPEPEPKSEEKKSPKKDKKKKSQAAEPEPEPEAEPETAPEREKKEEDHIWGFTTSKKDKKKKKKKCKTAIQEPEPEPIKEPEPEPEPEKQEEHDIWGSAISKNDKQKKGKAFEPEPEPEKEGDFWSIWGTSKPEVVTDPKREPLEEAAQQEDAKAGPAVTDDWSFCESDSKETKPETACGRQAEHVFGNGWKECYSCRDFIRQLSRQLATEGS